MVQSAEIGFAGFLARWIGRTCCSQGFAVALLDSDCLFGNSSFSATETRSVETVAKTNNTNLAIGFKKLLIDLTLVRRKSIPIL